MIKTLVCALATALLLASPPVARAACAHTAPTAVPITDRLGEGWWKERHAALLAAIAQGADPQVLLIGDSITNNYDKPNPPDEDFKPTWDAFYAPRHALNLGFSGDTTSNVLWRLAHGEVAGLHPKVAVLLIGTNDTGVGKRTAATAGAGIDAVVEDLLCRLPDTKVLLLGVLPSAVSPAKSAADAEVDGHLARRWARHPRVTYLDIGNIFRRPDGSLDTSLFYDVRLPQHLPALHPDTQAQRWMAEAIEPTLARMLGEPPIAPLKAMTGANTAVVPVIKLDPDSYDWIARHDLALAEGRAIQPQVVMIGDSITHFWSGFPTAARASGAESWAQLFGATPVLNLGFGSDRTENVLWRLQQGELDDLRPGTIVVNIGTNNLMDSPNARPNTPAEIATGVRAIVRDIRWRAPASRILVMAIFPRGDAASDPLRLGIVETNRRVKAELAGEPHVSVLDISSRYLTPEGQLRRDLLFDGTHPNAAGYRVWADALASAGVARSIQRPPGCSAMVKDLLHRRPPFPGRAAVQAVLQRRGQGPPALRLPIGGHLSHVSSQVHAVILKV